MREVSISDVTMKQAAASKTLNLTFKEKLEMAKLLDRLGVSAIETEGIEKLKVDSLRIKSLASLVQNSVLAVPVQMTSDGVEQVWDALKDAAHPRLQVEAAVSPSTMEYIYHKKADGMLTDVATTIAKCAELCDDIEFVADDATRADEAYLRQIISAAIDAGATAVTVCDAAGTMLPNEFHEFIANLVKDVPQLNDVTLGISCCDTLFMADACAIAGIAAGADELKATTYPMGVTSLGNVAKILADKQDVCGVETAVRTTEIKRAAGQIARICEQERSRFANASADEAYASIVLTANDDKDAVMACVEKLGYIVSEEDADVIYNAFQTIIANKERIGGTELDAIVASAAQQVPPTFVLSSYVINSGNNIKATSHVRLLKNGESIDAVCIGDGPIDASFMAIEQIVGKRYELDDFQLRSVTEGQEAVGEAVVKLISEGKMYSGRGVNTDIVGATINAYVNALNKIVYEEQN